MRTQAQKQKHYKSLANYYRNISIMKRQKASVHLEAKEDELFWERIFKYYFPDDNFRFITYSKSHHGNSTTGSAQCLAYKDYLSKEFIICIDSDYKYIYEEPEIDIQHYIFQTYTYSFENHLCYSKGLSDVCKKSTGYENNYFNFELFFKQYSCIVYELFVWHITLYKNNFKTFSIKEFWDVITIKKDLNDIQHQSKKYFSILEKKVRNKIIKLKRIYPSINFDKEFIRLHSLGIYEDNVYFFLRGHNIYALCVSLGREVCEWILNEEKQKLKGNSIQITQLYNERKTFKAKIKENIHFGAYKAINKIGEDMEYYKSYFVSKS